MIQQIYFQGSGQVLLHLPESKFRKRLSIGFIQDRALIIRKSRAKHLMRMYSGYAFNYDLISNHSQRFDVINLQIDGVNYFTTSKIILTKGKMLNFDELQICLPEKELCKTRHEAITKERELNNEVSVRVADIPERKIQLSMFAEAI